MVKQSMTMSLLVTKCVHHSIAISDAGNHLYAFGITNFPFNKRRRKLIYNPKLIVSILFMVLIRHVIILRLDDTNIEMLVKFGDI